MVVSVHKKALTWAKLVRFTQSPETGSKDHANRCHPILHLSPVQPRNTESGWEGRCMQVWFAAAWDMWCCSVLVTAHLGIALHFFLTGWTKVLFYLMLWGMDPQVSIVEGWIEPAISFIFCMLICASEPLKKYTESEKHRLKYKYSRAHPLL